MRRGQSVIKFTPNEGSMDVYSYFMFTIPIEDKRHGPQLTWNKFLAWLLVFCVLFLQGVMLYAIFQQIVISDLVWQDSIVEGLGHSHKCFDAESLCMRDHEDDLFSCAPPTVQLVGRWDELDTNGDGVWTMDEVKTAESDLHCKYGVNPVEVFHVFCNFLQERSNVVWLHPDITEHKAIARPYFEFIKSDIAMCNYRNKDMCPNLVKKGFFRTPLKDNTSPRVGSTINSALDYCYELLDDGATCERLLPSTYSVWRRNSEDQCKGATYSTFIYAHPTTGFEKSMLEVDYNARQDYHRAHESTTFLTYKGCIILIYLLAMFLEIKQTYVVAAWVVGFPSAKRFGEEAVLEEPPAPDDPENQIRYRILGISLLHRCGMGLIILVRFVMVIVLLWVGVAFLLQETDYLNLLLNGLGLIFIVDIIKVMYKQMTSRELQRQVEKAYPMEVPLHSSCRWWSQNPALREMVWFVVILVLMFTWYCHYYYVVVDPLTKALQCACLSDGDHCFESVTYNVDFWDNYWGSTLPKSFQDIEQIKTLAIADGISGTGGNADDVSATGPAKGGPALGNTVIHKGGRVCKAKTVFYECSKAEG